MRRERGWHRQEIAIMAGSYWAFRLMELAADGIRRVFPRFSILSSARLEPVWLWLGGRAYLYQDWRRGDMPPHIRIGGEWGTS